MCGTTSGATLIRCRPGFWAVTGRRLEMDALVRAANLPLQKIRQRIANPPEIVGDAVSPLPQQHPQPADSAESPEPEPAEPSADSDWQPLASLKPSSHRNPINAGQPLVHPPNGTLGASLPSPRPFAPKAPELITTQQAADRLWPDDQRVARTALQR